MSSKRVTFPMAVRSGSARVNIYRVSNKGRESFTISFFASGKRHQKMFTRFEDAHAEARLKAAALAHGDWDALQLSNAECLAFTQAVVALQPTGVALELAAKEYAEAWKVLAGKASILEAVREFARRQLPDAPKKLLPEAVKEMLEIKERDGASQAYLKVLRCYLGQLADAFHCLLRSVTTGQISDFLRNMQVSARSKNNARQTLGAFFKFCRERNWLPKDHDGISMVPKFKEKPTEIQIFTPAQLTEFLYSARSEMVPFLAIGAFAGLRSAEIARLDWAEVHLAEGFIEVKAAKSKTASRRLVPIQANLAKWLASYARPQGPVVPFSNLAKQLGWLVEDTNATLCARTNSGEGDRQAGEPLVWKKNALRHSYISYRVAEIQNVNQTALECGNSPAIIFRNYRELVRPSQAKNWFGIEPPR